MGFRFYSRAHHGQGRIKAYLQTLATPLP